MSVILAKKVDSRIFMLRGHRVILDSDLAELYGVNVKRLNQQIKRNKKRFPADFLVRVTRSEWKSLRLQIVTSNHQRGGRRYLPFAFTEHGATMAATVLNSERATKMSIFVVRAFVRMREELAANQQILSKLAQLERRIGDHDIDIQQLLDAIRTLMKHPAPPGRRIGFELPPALTNTRRIAS